MNILKRPMFFAALVCCAAAAVSLFSKSVAFLIIAVAFSVLLIVLFNKKCKYIVVLVAIILFTFSLFFEFTKIEKTEMQNNEKIKGIFLITEEPTDYGEFTTVELKNEKCNNLPNNIKLFCFDYKKSELKMGDIVDVTLKLNKIERTDKYRLSNYSSGIYATANIIELNKTGDNNIFYKTASNIRDYVKSTIASYFTGDTTGLLLALTTGDKTLLSDEFSANVKTTGISHVIVVSGMHLSIIMSAVFWLLDKLFYNKYIRCLFSVVTVVSICAICGFTMSIIRAGVMFIIAGLAPVFNRDNDSLSSLLTAVTVGLIGEPFAVFNVSFQLSVLSTLAIIWVVPFYYNILTLKFNMSSKFIKGILATVLCSIFAIIFTLPVTTKIFGYVSIVSPITNIIISYPVMIALVCNIIALILWAVPGVRIITYPLFLVAKLCSRFIVYIVNQIAKLQITVAVLPKSAIWWSLLLVVIVIGYMYFYDFKKKRSEQYANSV